MSFCPSDVREAAVEVECLREERDDLRRDLERMAEDLETVEEDHADAEDQLHAVKLLLDAGLRAGEGVEAPEFRLCLDCMQDTDLARFILALDSWAVEARRHERIIERHDWTAHGIPCSIWRERGVYARRWFGSITLPFGVATQELADELGWDTVVGNDLRVLFLTHVGCDRARNAVDGDAVKLGDYRLHRECAKTVDTSHRDEPLCPTCGRGVGAGVIHGGAKLIGGGDGAEADVTCGCGCRYCVTKHVTTTYSARVL